MGATFFEVYEGSSGKFYWHLRPARGYTIASGGPYSTRSSAEKAIESVKAEAPDAAVVYEEKAPKPLTAAELAHQVAMKKQAILNEMAKGRKIVFRQT